MADDVPEGDTAGATAAEPAGQAGPEGKEPAGDRAADGGEAAQDGPVEIHASDLVATGVLFLIFVATILLAIAFTQPFVQAELQAFEDPDAVGNSVLYIGLLLAFTAVILYLAKKGHKWVIQLVILTAVGGTIAYVVGPLLGLHPTIGPNLGGWIGLAAGIAGAVALWKYPEWFVIDVIGLVVAAGAAAIFGISLNVVPVVVFLVLLAVYDAIAVYKTKHMLDLADSVIDLRLPVLLVVPKHLGYSFRKEAAKFKEASEENKEEREAMFMGLGDLVMPTILVVSALNFAKPAWGTFPATGAGIGTLAGFLVLMAFVLRGRPQAGLPLLNGGALVGFLLGVYVTTGSLVFW